MWWGPAELSCVQEQVGAEHAARHCSSASSLQREALVAVQCASQPRQIYDLLASVPVAPITQLVTYACQTLLCTWGGVCSALFPTQISVLSLSTFGKEVKVAQLSPQKEEWRGRSCLWLNRNLWYSWMWVLLFWIPQTCDTSDLYVMPWARSWLCRAQGKRQGNSSIQAVSSPLVSMSWAVLGTCRIHKGFLTATMTSAAMHSTRLSWSSSVTWRCTFMLFETGPNNN